MKVLLVVNWYGSAGGMENYIANVSTLLEGHGLEVVVFYADAGLDLFHVPGRQEYRIPNLLDLTGRPPPASLALVRRLLDEERPDVAYIHTTVNPGLGELIVRRLPTVFFAHNHAVYCPSGTKLFRRSNTPCRVSFGMRCMANAYLQHCNSRRPWVVWETYQRVRALDAWLPLVDVHVVDSRFMQTRLAEAGIAADRIHILPSYILMEQASLAAEGPGQDERTVLFVGRFTPEKGLKFLFEAMARVPPPWRLVVAGHGYQAEEMQALAAHLQLPGAVEFFVGWLDRERLGGLYRACRLLVVPSAWPEPFGLVGPEAMSYGKPVVGFDVGGIPDWLRDGETGYLVPPGDVGHLAERIARLLDDPDLARRLGGQGRAFVDSRFGAKAHLDALLGIFGEAMRRRGAALRVAVP
ncbi:MAG: glycosyltransferase family 4 protein [Chloroflexi bacterium]|nr:glycosyltransferase family 4 protein [Chloroflexota bacterium]